MVCGDEVARFPEGGCEFFPRDFDVGDVEFVHSEFGAGADETPVPIGRDGMFGAHRIKAVFALDDEVSEAASERSGKGFTMF